MSTNDNRSLDGELLHRLHDGELAADERAVVEARLDEVARARLQTLADLGAAVRATAAAEAERAPAIDVWSAVAARIQPAAVIPFRRRVLRAAPLWISTVAAAAAAFAALILATSRPSLPTNGVAIEALEVSGAAVSVMQVHAPDHAPATVVWLTEE
jgi:hypothetical protein